MAKNKKITFNMIASDMKKADDTVITYAGENKQYEITVKKRLELGDATEFVRTIVDLCVSTDEGRYMIEFYDYAVMLATLVYYAGFEMPKDVAKSYSVLINTDLYDMVCDAIDIDQHVDLIGAALKKIAYARDLMVSERAARVNELLAKMDETISQGEELSEMIKNGELNALFEELINPGGIGEDAKGNNKAE